MKPVTNSSVEAYRLQLNQCAEAMAIARNESVADYLPKGDSPDLVDLFTDGNIDKRYEKLMDQLALLADLPELEARIDNYVRSVPLAAYSTAVRDADRFLNWLERRHSFTPEEQDLVTCLRARHQVEFLAGGARLRHLRFHELCSVADALRAGFGENDAIRIEINPIHQLAQFQTAVLFEGDDELELPVNAVFFPVGIDIRTAVLEEAGLQLFNALAEGGPGSLDDLSARFEGSRDELLDVCRDFVDLKLAALS